MRISFLRTGGVAGLHLSLNLDTDLMDSGSSAELEQLVQEAGFYGLPSRLKSAGRVRDAFEYRLRVSASALQDHEVVVDEQAAPGELMPLLGRLTLLALQESAHGGSPASRDP